MPALQGVLHKNSRETRCTPGSSCLYFHCSIRKIFCNTVKSYFYTFFNAIS